MQTPMSVFWAHICVIQTQTVMTPLAHTAVPVDLDQLEMAECVLVSLPNLLKLGVRKTMQCYALNRSLLLVFDEHCS